jgi:hypothetical protein
MLPFYKVAYCHKVLKPKHLKHMFAPYMPSVQVTLPHCQSPNYKALNSGIKDMFPKLRHFDAKSFFKNRQMKENELERIRKRVSIKILPWHSPGTNSLEMRTTRETTNYVAT